MQTFLLRGDEQFLMHSKMRIPAPLNSMVLQTGQVPQ